MGCHPSRCRPLPWTTIFVPGILFWGTSLRTLSRIWLIGVGFRDGGADGLEESTGAAETGIVGEKGV